MFVEVFKIFSSSLKVIYSNIIFLKKLKEDFCISTTTKFMLNLLIYCANNTVLILFMGVHSTLDLRFFYSKTHFGKILIFCGQPLTNDLFNICILY